MKEITYGWYPPVSDIYRPKGKPSSHHLQCLYKFRDYRAQPVVPEAELFVRGVSSTTTPDLSEHLKHKSKSAAIPKLRAESRINIPTPTQCWSKWQTQETQWGVTDDRSPETPDAPSEVSWPVVQAGKQKQTLQEEKDFQQKQQQMLKGHIREQQERYIVEGHQIPQTAWGFRKPGQDSSDVSSEASARFTWPKAHKAQPVRPQSSYSEQSRAHQEIPVGSKQRPFSSPAKSSISSTQDQRGMRPVLTPTPPTRENISSAKLVCRTKSATVRQEKVQLPSRPFTAFSERHLVPGQEPASLHSVQYEMGTRSPARPAAPAPLPINTNDTASPLPVATVPPISPSAQNEGGVVEDYETVVERYGWRAQVHGDPYNLKNPMKRESYTLKCTAPDILPDPPRIHMETNEPFFYNTFPRRPLSFAVDREWMSEVLLAKRLELQKRDHGIRYNYKNFAFVY
ncbi:hypothetical protein BsWGS_21887 [Bradybaena similaris]